MYTQCDPWLAPDFRLRTSALCWHGGPVVHASETFVLTWDPLRLDWSGTRGYVEQFQRDVADSSGSLSSPYAVTSQYRDGYDINDRAWHQSAYGGGCVDFGRPGGASCRFPQGTTVADGMNYPACSLPAASCAIDDGDIRSWLQTAVPALDLAGHVQQQLAAIGVTPVLVVRLPAGVSVCVASGCAGGSSKPARRSKRATPERGLMHYKRVIPSLDVDAGRVVKGVGFVDLRDAGDPVELACRYDAAGADKLVFLDITATSDKRETAVELARRAADDVFIPFTIHLFQRLTACFELGQHASANHRRCDQGRNIVGLEPGNNRAVRVSSHPGRQ